jgi:hypothetical protein
MTTFGIKYPHGAYPGRPGSVHVLGIFNGNDGHAAIHAFLGPTLERLSKISHVVVDFTDGQKVVDFYYNLTGDLCMIHSVQGHKF